MVIWNYRLQRRCKTVRNVSQCLQRNATSVADIVSLWKMLLFQLFFLQRKAYSSVQVVQKNRSQIWPGRPIAQAVPDWKLAHFSRYTTRARLGLLVFGAFFDCAKCTIRWRISPASLNARNFSLKPYRHGENDDAPKRFFGCTMVVFPGANCTESVPFLQHLVHLRSYF